MAKQNKKKKSASKDNEPPVPSTHTGDSENKPRNIFILDATTPYIFEYTRFGVKNRLHIHQTPQEDTWPGGVVWDSGVILGRILVSWTRGASSSDSAVAPLPRSLSSCGPSVWKDMVVLELGCGTGLTGLVAASLGAKLTILTDLKVVVNNVTQLNVEENSQLGPSKTCGYRITRVGGKVVAMPLCWGNAEDEEATRNKLREMTRRKGETGMYPNWILIGDVAYQQNPGAPSHFDALLSTLLRFVGPSTKVLFGTRTRMAASQDLLQLFQAHLQECVHVPAHEVDPRLLEVGRKHNMTIHIFEQRYSE